MKIKLKKVNIIVIIILVFIMLFISFGIKPQNVMADNSWTVNENESHPLAVKDDEKVYCNANISEDFTSNEVIVVLEHSISNVDGITENLTNRLFKNIGLSKISDLSKLSNSAKNNLQLKNYLEKADFRQILSIELNKKSK